MTREESIEFGNMWLEVNEDCKDSSTYAFFQTAIKALKQEPCEDCVSREALYDAISDLTYWHFENGRLITGGGGNKTETVYKVDDVTRLTHILPPVTPQPETGHWVNIDATHSKCDRCGAIFEIVSENGGANYCPNCGVKMEVDG